MTGWKARIRAWAQRLKQEVLALWLAARHPRTPWYAKWLALAIVAYAVSPIDLIPDFIPVLGYLDDLLLLPLAIWLVIRLLPPDVLAECREEARLRIENAPPAALSYWVIAVIVALWLLVMWLIWRYWLEPWLAG